MLHAYILSHLHPIFNTVISSIFPGRIDRHWIRRNFDWVEATIRSDLGEAQVYDMFMVRNGKATHHFSGIISP
jgi:hypothetical protein